VRVVVHSDKKKLKKALKTKAIEVSAGDRARLKKDADEVDATAKKVTDKIEKLLKDAKGKVEAQSARGKHALSTVANVLLQDLPKLKSIDVSPVYIECLYNPSSCNEKLINEPTVSVCFTKVGCATGTPTTVSTFAKWLRQKAVKLMVKWMKSALKFEKHTFKLPMALEHHHLSNDKPTSLPSHVSTQDYTLQFPVSSNDKALQAMKNKPQENGMPVSTATNSKFTESGMMKKLAGKAGAAVAAKVETSKLGGKPKPASAPPAAAAKAAAGPELVL
jgi:hypothetical protein